MKSLNPYDRPMTPCWHCISFVALTAQGSAAVCGRTRSGSSTSVVASPRRGCAFFTREVGVDDEPDWVPQPVSQAELQAMLSGQRVVDGATQMFRTPAIADAMNNRPTPLNRAQRPPSQPV